MDLDLKSQRIQRRQATMVIALSFSGRGKADAPLQNMMAKAMAPPAILYCGKDEGGHAHSALLLRSRRADPSALEDSQ